MAHRRPAGRAADAARRGAVGARDLRRDAVHGRPPLRPGARPGARFVAAGGGRAADDAPPALAVDAGRTGTRPVAAPSLLRFGSWIGSDRDGHPGVTAEITLHAARLQADHLLRGYEAVASRLMQTVAARVAPERVDRALDHALARDAEELPETDAPAPAPLPRGAVPAAARRDRGAHPADAGGDDRRDRRRARAATRAPAALDAELASLQHALVEDGLGRVAWGEVADLRWQLADVRVPPRLARGPPARGRRTGRRSRRSDDGRRAGRRGRGRRHGGRGPRDVPGDRAPPGAVRRRGVPAVRDLVHDQPRRRRGRAGARAPRRGARAVRPAGRRRSPTCRRTCPSSTSSRCSRAPTRCRARPSSSTACSPTRPTAPTSAIAATPRR